MRKQNSGVKKYWKQYEWSNILALMRNSRAVPALCKDDFQGRLLVITGATSGIGYYTSRKYASLGANILSINRNEEKSEKLCKELRQDFGADCDYKIADMSRLDDVHLVGQDLADLNDEIDVLLHNAGLYLNHKRLTNDGLEVNFMVNYLSSFIINYLVKDKLRGQGKSRVLMTNSEGHRFALWGIHLDDLNWEKKRFTGLRAYGTAKASQLLSMLIFDEYFKNSGVTINAMHPGAVRTGTGKENGPVYKWFKRNFTDRLSQSPEISAEALYYLGVSPQIDGVSGKFFHLTTEEQPAPPVLDREVANELWEISLRLGGLK